MSDENPFRAALEWFGPHGERWGQGSFVLDDGRRCAYGGLAEVLRIDIEQTGEVYGEVYGPAAVLLDDLAHSFFPDRWDVDSAVARFTASVNDHPDTTFDDIRAIFEKAAVRWDERI